MEKPNIKDLSFDGLIDAFSLLGAPAFRARQTYSWLYCRGAISFDDMSDMPQDLRRRLKEKYRISHPVMLDSRHSAVDGTTKYLLKLDDGNTIETVFLPEARRNTICLSSQVGCRYACSFCASAPFGFLRNLTAAEILDEAIFIKRSHPKAAITNIVFMGIGEPLDNYDNVMRAVRVFNDKNAFGIGARKITISTCGIIPGMRRLSEEEMQIELSVSLHSADDAVRSKMLPVNKKYPLKELIAACREYALKTNRLITFEYVLIKGVNSSRRDAVLLARLLKGLACKVNTISYNMISAKDYGRPSEREAGIFLSELKARGINAMHRKSKGADIDAGCGQLRISRLR